MRSLLLFIEKNLTSSSNASFAEENEVLKYYLKAGAWWVNQKLTSIPGIAIPQIAEKEFTNFVFEESIVLEIINQCTNVTVSCYMEDVRPEIFQTALMGKKYIHEV